MDKRAFSIIVGALVLSFAAGWLSHGSPAVKVEAQVVAKQESASDNKLRAGQTAQLKCPDGAILTFTGEVDSDNSSKQSGEAAAKASAELTAQASRDRFMIQAITDVSQLGMKWGAAGSVRVIGPIYIGAGWLPGRPPMASVGVSW